MQVASHIQDCAQTHDPGRLEAPPERAHEGRRTLGSRWDAIHESDLQVSKRVRRIREMPVQGAARTFVGMGSIAGVADVRWEAYSRVCAFTHTLSLRSDLPHAWCD